MIQSNMTFKKQILEQAKSFIGNAGNRTIDIVPDIRILISQFASWNDLSEEYKGNG